MVSTPACDQGDNEREVKGRQTASRSRSHKFSCSHEVPGRFLHLSTLQSSLNPLVPACFPAEAEHVCETDV